MKKQRFTKRQRLFCREYLLNDGNGTQAAIKAGYTKKSAKEAAYELLTYPHIQEFLEKRMSEVEKKLDITFENKLELLWKCAKRCSGDTEFTDFIPASLINAVGELNKMQGHYAAEKREIKETHELGDKLTELVKKHAKDY